MQELFICLIASTPLEEESLQFIDYSIISDFSAYSNQKKILLCESLFDELANK